MPIPKVGLALAAVCASLLIIPVTAGAATPTTPQSVTSLSNVRIAGVARNHKQFTGHFNVDRFVTRGGKTYALGTVTGRLGNRRITRSNVAFPAHVVSSSAAGFSKRTQ